jgi:hypothetical protein
MEISAIDQEVSDFDWFAVDSGNYLVHFASAGGRLPNSVASSKENLDLLKSYFLGLPILFAQSEIFVAPTKAPFPYLECAFRGLFSYDGNVTGGAMDTVYQLVAQPPHVLTLADLPLAVAAIVTQTQLPFAVAGLVTLDTSAVS